MDHPATALSRAELCDRLAARILAARLRPDRRWSQEYCWTKAGISRAQWQRLEGGYCLPQPLTWAALCGLFPEFASSEAK